LDGHDRAFVPDRLLGDGDRLDAPEFSLGAVHTPGHASNHLCFELVGDGLLFSGDHVMEGSTVVIAPLDGDMAVYLESLEKVRRMGLRRIAPGHGHIIEDPAAVLDEYRRHRLAREVAIAALVAPVRPEEPVTIEQLVEAIYVDVPAHLHPIARYSVWAHLRKLATEGAVISADIGDIEAPWWARDSQPPPPG
jgi:glyoxylase-like metal-dependent hydrolase (beta-lactamase superfamily II)